jgi:N-acetylglucosamine-6-phosphate deacetylase
VAALLPRHPNLIWAQLADDRLTAFLIADGHHLPPDTFRAMVRAKGVQRCVLTSDAVALAGLPAVEYTTAVGGRVVIAEDRSIRLPGSTLLAGSGPALVECVRWATASGGVTLAEATAVACEQPAALLGIAVCRWA